MLEDKETSKRIRKGFAEEVILSWIWKGSFRSTGEGPSRKKQPEERPRGLE